MSQFRNELKALLNIHSRENQSNTPDYVLADYLTRCLEAFDLATIERDRFWNEEKPKKRR